MSIPLGDINTSHTRILVKLVNMNQHYTDNELMANNIIQILSRLLHHTNPKVKNDSLISMINIKFRNTG